MTLIKRLLFALFLMPALALAQTSPPTNAPVAGPVENDIETVIRNQIEAFRTDDFIAAYSYASPNIRRLFGSAENFGLMVRRGYPMVWRPNGVQFLDLQNNGGRLLQSVQIRDMRGAYHILDYVMVQTPEGWRIDGVFLRPQLEASV